LAAEHPADARLVYEWACAVEQSGDLDSAVPLHERALALGLREPHRHLAVLQLAAAHRELGRPEDALAALQQVSGSPPQSVPAAGWRALAQLDLGRPELAVAELLETLLEQAGDLDTAVHRERLRAIAVGLRGPQVPDQALGESP
jgi:cyanophycin synthetase